METRHISNVYPSRIGFPDKECARCVTRQDAVTSNSQPIARVRLTNLTGIQGGIPRSEGRSRDCVVFRCNAAMECIGCAIYRVNLFAMGIVVVLVLGLMLAISSKAFAQQSTLPDFTQLAADNTSAVVNISSSKQQNGSHELPPEMQFPDLPEDHPLSDLLRRFFGEQGGRENGELPSTKSLGSGFIMSEDGYVVTNHHVVKDADEIIVTLSDRREIKAQVIGTDARSDLALLKIEATGLPVLKFGSSENLKPGEWVLAIGSPFGLEHSVTAGIVSAKGRSLPTENYVPFIQTDVAINPGNSGGPLFNLDGEVVGINSQIYSRTGGFMGLSFAIPVEVAMDVVEQLKAKGHVSRGWLGVYIQEVTRELAESFSMSKPTGALVASVLPDSPAGDAGIRVGDIILNLGDQEVTSSSSLPPLVGRIAVGKEVKLNVMREGKNITVNVKIGELPPNDPAVQAKQEGSTDKDAVLGMEIKPLTPEQRENFKIDEGGVYVAKLFEGLAKSSGIQEGDVLQTINNEKIVDVEQFKKMIENLPKDKYASVLVQRSQGPQFIAMKVPEQ